MVARRRRIIEAARSLFVSNGFHATGVAQIARASGVAVGQIYRDFEAKEDIVAAIVEDDCYAFLERDTLHRAIAAGDTAAVWRWIRHFLGPDDRRGTEALFAEIIAESSRNERIATIFARKRQEVSRNVLAALTSLLPNERLERQRLLLADLVLALSLGLLHERLFRPGLDTTALVDKIVDTIAREIAASRNGPDPAAAD